MKTLQTHLILLLLLTLATQSTAQEDEDYLQRYEAALASLKQHRLVPTAADDMLTRRMDDDADVGEETDALAAVTDHYHTLSHALAFAPAALGPYSDDVETGTRFWESYPAAMQIAVAQRHIADPDRQEWFRGLVEQRDVTAQATHPHATLVDDVDRSFRDTMTMHVFQRTTGEADATYDALGVALLHVESLRRVPRFHVQSKRLGMTTFTAWSLRDSLHDRVPDRDAALALAAEFQRAQGQPTMRDAVISEIGYLVHTVVPFVIKVVDARTVPAVVVPTQTPPIVHMEYVLLVIDTEGDGPHGSALIDEWIVPYLRVLGLAALQLDRPRSERTPADRDRLTRALALVPENRADFMRVMMDMDDMQDCLLALSEAALQLEIARQKTGTYPEQLADLPRDPFAGRPLTYRRQGAGFVLYSVGLDGRDDGGDGDLWRLNGRDIVWLQTAPPQRTEPVATGPVRALALPADWVQAQRRVMAVGGLDATFPQLPAAAWDPRRNSALTYAETVEKLAIMESGELDEMFTYPPPGFTSWEDEPAARRADVIRTLREDPTIRDFYRICGRASALPFVAWVQDPPSLQASGMLVRRREACRWLGFGIYADVNYGNGRSVVPMARMILQLATPDPYLQDTMAIQSTHLKLNIYEESLRLLLQRREVDAKTLQTLLRDLRAYRVAAGPLDTVTTDTTVSVWRNTLPQAVFRSGLAGDMTSAEWLASRFDPLAHQASQVTAITARLPALRRADLISEAATRRSLLQMMRGDLSTAIPWISYGPQVSMMTKARLQLTETALAIMYWQAEKPVRRGRWPENLEALVPDILPALPLDPYTGEPLRYERRGEGFVVYSVGEDRVDDGGESTSDRLMLRGRDKVWYHSGVLQPRDSFAK